MHKQWLALACGVAVMPALVHAQEVAGKSTDQTESAEERAWDIELEAAYLLKSGNSNSESIVGKANATHEGLDWRQTAKAEAVNTTGEDDDTGDDERTAERYYASYQLDRKFDDNNYLFNVLTYQKDTFSGYQYQASYAFGLGRRFIDTTAHTLDLEAGPGYRVECIEPENSYFSCDDKQESAIARFAGKYQWVINPNATFKQNLISEVGEENTTLRSETSLTSKINDHFAMRLSYLVTRDSEVPAGTHKTDQETTVSVVYTY
ncbi:DUF481 domain-containing protein [Alloalcanivorax mobilis]|uniref:DUF481 domain-containing protein n=1 Tax=Alloalcanivorax mobilis TaxID=2019569 RepID=UPI000B5B1676|nr:DUF481 domain-containing protein [Alloalcanivorax mobilis]ASK33835.1 hypothetical protein CEK62_05230 [Alcanivorax sp. N3-2A]|tara:strand:- start:75963 stop:76751 length:789 start_codon:yes stop_codon:yes gene_type:complete